MSYQIIPNITFILSVLGVLLIVFRHLPQASNSKEQTEASEAEANLKGKGLPAQAISTIKVRFFTITRRIWHFVLEAKDLRPHSDTGYKMKKIFGGKLALIKKPPVFVAPSQTLHEVKNEQYFLDVIKLQPRNLTNYDGLGKFYLEKENVSDAKDIYLYLANHQPSNPDYHARLAYCFYQLKNYSKAAEHYQKSVALDSTQPNRYYNLGLSLEAAGRAHEASKALKKAHDMEPTNPKFQLAVQKNKGGV